MKAERVKWFDSAKGIGILLVVVGHSVTASLRHNSFFAMDLYTFIYFMHMPFWFCISGYGFRISEKKSIEEKFKVFFMKRVKGLLVPYVVMSICVYIIFELCSLIPRVGSIMDSAGYGSIQIGKYIYGLVVGDNSFSLHLWFIYVLFFYNVLTLFVKKVFKNQYILVVIAILFLVAAKLLNLNGFIVGIPNFLFYYFWFVIGNVFSLEDINKKIAMVLFAASLMGVMVQPQMLQNFGENSYIYYIQLIVFKTMAVIGLIVLARWVSMKSSKLINYLGRHSFEIYLFHQPFFGSIYGTIIFIFFGMPVPLVIITTTLLCIIAPLFIGKMLRKTRYLEHLFGLAR